MVGRARTIRVDLESARQHLDEAVETIELRRYHRIFSAGRLPFIYAAAVFLVAGLLVPFFFSERGILAGSSPISGAAGWEAGVLIATSVLGAALGAYLRAQHLWSQERHLRTIQAWILTRQDPARAAATTVVMSALLGLGLVAIPACLGLVLAAISGQQSGQVLLSILLLALCALLGASLGAAVFFINQRLVRRRLYYPALVLLGLLTLGLWLRIEAVENGWSRSWGEHPGRITQALSLLTPIPTVFGISAPGWWDQQAAPRLGWDIDAWQAGLLYALFLLVASCWATWMAVRGYRSLAADPDQIEEKPQAPAEEVGREYYWKGFRNPVWTRDIRTRLRSKDTAEFIFFASIAVAAGAFVPLVMTASDLSDPLQTARAARQVFFWLTMTLVALVALIAPGLTSDTITMERAQGTLEMLVGTPLRPRQILGGKLLGAISVLLLLISPSLPLFGLCYLFHGASSGQVVTVYLLLIMTLSVCAFIGLTQSSINARAGAAKFWAYAITTAFVAVPGGPFWIAAAAAAPQAEMRQMLMNNASVTALVLIFCGFGLLLFWGNACEQLEYSEY
jgi:ABC-type transport system involved in multi-copper enzyme maturation permease subunit